MHQRGVCHARNLQNLLPDNISEHKLVAVILLFCKCEILRRDLLFLDFHSLIIIIYTRASKQTERKKTKLTKLSEHDTEDKEETYLY